MKSEFTADICGRRVKLAVPLGAWEELAKAGHDKPLMLEKALREGEWTLAQAIDSFGIALKHGGSGLSASEALEAHGLLECVQWAHAALMSGLIVAEPEKKKDAAPARRTKAPSK